MNVREIMSGQPVCIAPETHIVTAAVTMADHELGAIPVCEQGRLVGIITDRDIVVRYMARGSVHHGQLVTHYMTRNPVTIGPDEPLERAEALMAQHQIRRVPVCDEGRLVGMITQADLARRASHEQLGALVEAIRAAQAMPSV
jgi:CBS domain-containing protein